MAKRHKLKTVLRIMHDAMREVVVFQLSAKESGKLYAVVEDVTVQMLGTMYCPTGVFVSALLRSLEFDLYEEVVDA